MRIFYRPQRGTLDESMRKSEIFNTVIEMFEAIGADSAIYYCYDVRLKAETFAVLSGKKAIGFMWFKK